MSNIIGILNYGIAGNIRSIDMAIKKAGGTVKIINHRDDFIGISKLVIPGVGSFNDTIRELNKNNLFKILKEKINTIPTLGICLGMHILAKVGYEHGKSEGLNIFDSKVRLLNINSKIPHVGFNQIKVIKTNKLLYGLENEEFYFMHSYEFICDYSISSITNYCGYDIISSINKGNVYGVQFHPEKSKEQGIKLFKNFINL